MVTARPGQAACASGVIWFPSLSRQILQVELPRHVGPDRRRSPNPCASSFLGHERGLGLPLVAGGTEVGNQMVELGGVVLRGLDQCRQHFTLAIGGVSYGYGNVRFTE